jgi:hypothetical protein
MKKKELNPQSPLGSIVDSDKYKAEATVEKVTTPRKYLDESTARFKE